MSIRYDNPREIGPDRLVNAVAGFEKVGGACVVVDFGTAVTHDVVSEDGEYLGGVIFPGVEISLEALTERAAALPDDRPHAAARGARQVDRRRDPLRRRSTATPGWSTGSSSACATRSATARAIATGGLAAAVVPYCELIDEVDDLLTLTGPAAHLGAEPLSSAGSSAIERKTRRAPRPRALRRRQPRVAEHVHPRAAAGLGARRARPRRRRSARVARPSAPPRAGTGPAPACRARRRWR